MHTFRISGVSCYITAPIIWTSDPYACFLQLTDMIAYYSILYAKIKLRIKNSCLLGASFYMHNIKIGIQYMYIKGYFSIQNGYVVVSRVFTFISENP